MDNVQCVGTETDLDDCEHGGWGQHNCGHNEDVSIFCDGIGKKNMYLYLTPFVHFRAIFYNLSCNRPNRRSNRL